MLLLDPTKAWSCPNCDHTHRTVEAAPHTPFHPCKGLKGLTAPMVEAGTAAKVVAVERGDYINGDMVQYDGAGRPVMSIVTTRDDGQDTAVLAPTATGRL